MATATVTNSGPAGGRPRRTRLPAAARRETILIAATEVFGDVGYRAGRVADIAARVGVTEPVIFQNFGSKADLFAAVLERAASDVRTALDEMTPGHGSPGQLLAHLLSATDGDAGSSPAGDHAQHHGHRHSGAAYHVLFADAAALTAEPELTEPMRAAVRAVAAHLADLIDHAKADGAVREDVDAEAAAWLLLSVPAARRLRSAAMPESLEAPVIALALQALAPSPGR